MTFRWAGAGGGSSGGGLLNVQAFTAAGAYSPSPGARAALVRGVGPGGGGAGGIGGSGYSQGGGGSPGAYAEIWIPDLQSGGAVVAGAPGTGGNGANGNNGTAASITINGITYTFAAGLGGVAMATGSANAVAAGGAAAALTSGAAVLFSTSASGGEAFRGSIARSGNGGSSPFGIGGDGTSNAPAVGRAGNGFGAGGGGAAASTTNNLGGNGSPFLFLVQEYG